jgi:conjugative transfer signal peptidase TraF
MISRLSLGAIAAFTALAVIARLGHVRIITTDSAAPAGIYRTVHAPLTRNELVLACLPVGPARLALARGYLGGGDCAGGVEPLAKVIGALPGDSLDIEASWLAINGTRIPNSPTLLHDSANRPLEHVAWGTRSVAPGEVWLFGFNNPRSWDGRFFGPVSIGDVRGRLVAIVTW